MRTQLLLLCIARSEHVGSLDSQEELRCVSGGLSRFSVHSFCVKLFALIKRADTKAQRSLWCTWLCKVCMLPNSAFWPCVFALHFTDTRTVCPSFVDFCFREPTWHCTKRGHTWAIRTISNFSSFLSTYKHCRSARYCKVWFLSSKCWFGELFFCPLTLHFHGAAFVVLASCGHVFCSHQCCVSRQGVGTSCHI